MEKLSIIPNEREIIEKLKENYNKNVKESSNILFSYEFLLKQTKIDILPKINVKQIYLYKTFSNYFDDTSLGISIIQIIFLIIFFCIYFIFLKNIIVLKIKKFNIQ